jgi:hypothetical protein
MVCRFVGMARLPGSLVLVIVALGCGGGNSGPPEDQTAPGAEATAKTTALATGAELMQAKAPVDRIAMYLVGFHPMKAEPSMQMESHHYCTQVNEDFAQCVLFDGNTDSARLHGVEYIISAQLYATLPADERPYWHPHNYEILSGQLRAPGLPDAAEDEAMKTKLNSYGKTWHLWKTGVHGQPADALPLGPPHLAWSFNHDGEMVPALGAARDSRMRLDSGEARRRREPWAADARPQAGVDVLASQFPSAKGAPAGVQDAGDASARGTPVITMRK